MNYLLIKHLHITCAALSGGFFLLRGIWMVTESPLLSRRWVKTLPHLIDSILLLSALTLVFWSGQYPFVQPWLTAKVGALVGYIVLGSVALKYGKQKPVRFLCLLLALTVFGFIVGTALTKDPLFAWRIFQA
ncbi:MAG TPA: SirB2 family protein [Noviherbaspirillum sp.]|uniref:SirB2 family protein n=1 Tax=Noviherbaspirillum sp. TaxID=1926288 RepID=UPI002DDCA8F0|nr:SirB2 family protein [Noviherbaspirillum sp.]HEV2608935.1 SirB2 family protein [Noviherbaspirillum sp.]